MQLIAEKQEKLQEIGQLFQSITLVLKFFGFVQGYIQSLTIHRILCSDVVLHRTEADIKAFRVPGKDAAVPEKKFGGGLERDH